MCLPPEKIGSAIEDLADSSMKAKVGDFLAQHSAGSTEVRLDDFTDLFEAFLAWNPVNMQKADAAEGPLLDAIADDDADAVEEALARGSFVRTALCTAAESASEDVAQVLLQAGVDIDAKRAVDGRTPLMIAASLGKSDLVELLLGNGADACLRDAADKSARDLCEDEEIASLIEEATDSQAALPAAPTAASSKPKNAGRRVSVSAESYDPTKAASGYTKRIVEKSAEDRERLLTALERNFLFKQMDNSQKEDLVDAMFEVRKVAGEDIITQGDREANEFYLLAEGNVDVYKQTSRSSEAVKLLTLPPGSTFGELALMYNTARAATVRAASEAVVLWAMDRESFKHIVLIQTMQKRIKYESFLEKVELLRSLSSYERAVIADSLVERKLGPGEQVINEGDSGDELFFVVSGTAEAHAGGVKVADYAEGARGPPPSSSAGLAQLERLFCPSSAQVAILASSLSSTTRSARPPS